jgi:cytochrome c oxidase subunit II
MNKFRSAFVVPALVVMAFSSLPRVQAQDAAAQEVRIVAKKFQYTPSEVHLKKGQAVTLILTSEDTAHGLKCKDLNLEALISPGQETKVTITPETAGTFTAYCNKFCGSGHFGMKMKFVVE